MHESRSRAVSVAAGGVIGALVTALAAARLEGFDSHAVYLAMPTLISGLGGVPSGALCGFLVWALWRPRQRVATAAVVLVSLNCAAWSLFLLANAPSENTDASIRDQRAQLDLDAAPGRPNGMTMDTSHPPTLLAGRSNTWVTLSEKPLALFAGPAVIFAHEQLVPARYRRAGATVSESYWIAAAGFVVSTAWWVAVGSMLRRRRGDDA